MRTAVVLLLVAAGCVDNTEGGGVDESYVKANLLAAEPAPTTPVNADLGGKVVYLGADIDRQTAAPGDKVKIVHFWKVVETPGGEWAAFTHVNGTKEWVNIDETKMRKGYGPSRWKTGDIVKDEQTFTLPSTWTSPFAAIYVGIYKKGGTKVSDRMKVVRGPSDGQDRVLVAKIPVAAAGAGAAKTEKPAFAIRKTAAAITIDGKADEPAWAQAPSTGEFTSAEGAPIKPSGPTRARLLWDDTNLYAFIDVEDKEIKSQFTKQDDPLWQEDVVELFIDADKNRRGYVELQVNPNNAHFDTWFAIGRPNRDDSYDSGMKSAVAIEGNVWHVELAIPLAAVKGKDEAMKVTIPPAIGDTWKLNLVRVDRNSDMKEKQIAAAGWAQIPYSDFHALDRLMVVQFADEAGSVTAAPAPSPEPVSTPAPAADDKPKPKQIPLMNPDGTTKLDRDALMKLPKKSPTPAPSPSAPPGK
jgi:hypothetical protein